MYSKNLTSTYLNVLCCLYSIYDAWRPQKICSDDYSEILLMYSYYEEFLLLHYLHVHLFNKKMTAYNHTYLLSDNSYSCWKNTLTHLSIT